MTKYLITETGLNPDPWFRVPAFPITLLPLFLFEMKSQENECFISAANHYCIAWQYVLE